MDFSQPFRVLTPTLDGPVLRALSRSDSAMTRPQVLSLAGEGSEAGIRKVLNRLVEQGLVIQERIGIHYTYRANRDHILWDAVEVIVAAHERLDARIKIHVSKWNIQPLSVELFGSVATGQSTIASDIDLMVVSPFVPDDQDEEWNRQVDDLRESVERWTGNACEILIMDPPQLVEARANDEPALKSPRVSVAGDTIDSMLPTLEIARKFSKNFGAAQLGLTNMPAVPISPELKKSLDQVSKAAAMQISPQTRRLFEEISKSIATYRPPNPKSSR